jgi:hypothetical protein
MSVHFYGFADERLQLNSVVRYKDADSYRVLQQGTRNCGNGDAPCCTMVK